MAVMVLVYPMLFLSFFDTVFMDFVTAHECMNLFDEMIMMVRLVFIILLMSISGIMRLMDSGPTISMIVV